MNKLLGSQMKGIFAFCALALVLIFSMGAVTQLDINTRTFGVLVPGRLGVSTYTTLTDGATITWAMASVPGAGAKVTIAGNRTLNITNPVAGTAFYTLFVTQDATGSRTLTLGTGCTWKVVNGGGGILTLTTTPSATDSVVFTYDGANCWVQRGLNYN